MLLGNYFHNINKNYKNFSFSGISFDTKSIKKNNIFFAIKGNSIDGNKFIPKAIKKGSKIIVTEKKVNQFQNGILYIYTKNIRKLLAETAFKIYSKKPKNLIAVTGTNGKSSVADFYYQILKLNNKKVASIGIGCRRWITLHGMSLNVDCDLSGFNQIVPCGLNGFRTGRLSNWIPAIKMREVHALMKISLNKHFGLLWTG